MKNSIQLAKTAFSFLILTGLFALPAKASNSCQKVLSNRTVLMDQARLEVNGFERINSVTIPMDVSKKILERLLLLGDVGHFTMNRSGEIDILRVLKHHKDFVTHYEEVKKFLSDYAQPIFIKLVSDLTEHLNQRVPDKKYSFVLLELRCQGPDGRIYKDLYPSNTEVFTFHFDGGPLLVTITPIGAPTEWVMDSQKFWIREEDIAQPEEGQTILYSGKNRIAGGGKHRASPMPSPNGRIFIRLTFG